MKTPLPEFDNPPVTEVVLGVQFDRLKDLHTPQLGYIWQCFRDKFPKTEEHPRLEPVFEQFGPKLSNQIGVHFEMLQVLPTPRLWFLNEMETELVQIQDDRFIRNWRKRSDDHTYPRYAVLRAEFAKDFKQFEKVIANEGLEAIQVNQCEVTYLNVIPAGEGWTSPGELAEVFTLFTPEYSDKGLLGIPEEAVVTSSYIIKNKEAFVGRLHVAIAPFVREVDGALAFRMSLVARGLPTSDGLDGVLAFLDLGHETIVRSFASLTTPKMHRIWGRKS